MQTELPEETKRIHEEAKAWADTLVKTMGGVLRIDRALCEGCYEQGVTNEATRAQVLVEGLKEIEKIVLKYHSLNGDNPVANHCRNIAMESLVKYHQ